MNKINEFQLASGRRVKLISINQSETYAGVLEGLPTLEMNLLIIEENVKVAKLRWNEAPYLIEPIETPIIWEREYPLGIPVSIPLKVCIAQLRSNYPRGSDPSHYTHNYSLLSLVWFQNEFAFPIENSVLEQIHGIDWDKHAYDYVYE